MNPLEDLRVRLHELWSAGKHNATVSAVEDLSIQDSAHLLVQHMPGGTFVEPLEETGGGGGVSPIFGVKVRAQSGGFEVTIAQGLIGGVEPKIGNRRISEKTTGKVPTLLLKPEHFDAEGQARLYIRVNLTPQWNIASCVPVLSATKLGDEAWAGHELLGIFVRRGGSTPRYVRFAFSNKKHLAVMRRSSGLARNLFIMDA